MFLQFVFSKYEKRSTIYASNKGFSEWGEILGDQVMASAVLNRILHHRVVVNIKGESYRLRDRRRKSLPTKRRREKIERKIIWGWINFIPGDFAQILTGVYMCES